MRCKKSLLAVSVLILLLARGQVLAWNSVGHMTVAYVAYQELTQVERARVAALLIRNPYYKKVWLTYLPAGTSNADRDMYVFMMAATWPDEIRAVNSGFSGNDDAPKGELISLNDGYKAKQRHEYWHFVDTPFSQDGTTLPSVPEPTIVEKITGFRAALATAEPDLLKSYDLVWLLHLVGDVHQPLHCTTRVTSTKPHGDLGGNLVLIQGESKNLHTFWDDLLGTGETKDFMKAVAAGKTLPAPDSSQAADGNEDHWAAESFSLAETKVYVDPVGPGLGTYDLSGDYTTNAEQLAEARIALAGARLANLLKTALQCDSKSCKN
jgi:hypothetical protein